MQLNPTIDKFYNSILSYAGLVLSDNIIKNENSAIGDLTIDNKFLTLPYFSNLKDPNNKIIFHLLNENYTNPENSVFDLYKRRLILELNIKLSHFILNLLAIAADVSLQQKVRDSRLINLISDIGEVDHSTTENFLKLMQHSKKNNNEAFIFDIYLKKNGTIKDETYSAIGKINFTLPNEIGKSLEDRDSEYRVYGYKMRKKDLIVLTTIFNMIFIDIGNQDKYSEGTDNRIFRYLNALLKTSYLVAKRINDLVEILSTIESPDITIENCSSNLDWCYLLEDLYKMPGEIRVIPSQIDVSIESTKLRVDESMASNVKPEEPVQTPPTYNPQQALQHPPVQNYQQQPTVQPQMQPMQPQPPQTLSPEDIIRGNMQRPNNPYPMQNMNYNMPMAPNQNYNLNPQNMPAWMQQEMMQSSPQGLMYPGQQQPMYYPNMAPMQPQMQPMQQNSLLNPLFSNSNVPGFR